MSTALRDVQITTSLRDGYPIPIVDVRALAHDGQRLAGAFTMPESGPNWRRMFIMHLDTKLAAMEKHAALTPMERAEVEAHFDNDNFFGPIILTPTGVG